jgi:hypothetical protein
MYRARIYLLAALFVSTTFTEAAEEYVIPTGVSVLTEDQLLDQIIGNTLMGGNYGWVVYFLPASGDQKKGRFKGRNSAVGPIPGDWSVNGSLMCWHFDSPTRVSYNGCFTTALDGDTVTWYLPSGNPRYSRAGRIKLISGNPENY